MQPFDDAELERFYQRIEARTSGGPGPQGQVRRARDNRSRDQPRIGGDCPTPDKSAHINEYDAWLAVAVLRAGTLRKPGLDVYRCRCGWWHITSRGPN
ncbi:hypothetical protein GCM10010528_04510 [Gordonia defluvii]|jgi:hypothetical protein|uniref:Uncharacterized protein n=1 Tax=Gordonia defluvii TaxID=283718 RepID=A0ABP6L0Y6_9ACTN|nr:hypothetical protein [Gordonia sp. UBA5067]